MPNVILRPALLLGATAACPGWSVAQPPPAADGQAEAIAELEVLLETRATPEALADLVRWMMRNNDAFVFTSASVDTPQNTYSHPILERLHRSTRSLP